MPGDIITEVNGEAVVSAREILDAVERFDSLSITVLRHEKVLRFVDIQPESV